MKNLILFLFALLLSIPAFPQTNFIEKPWAEVLAIAKQQNKPVFVDVFTQSCGPCKIMDREVFSDVELGKYMNDSLISVKMDVGVKENRWVLAKYQINAFPTFLYFSPEGDMVFKSTGRSDISGFKQLTRDILSKMPSLKPISAFENEYIAKKNDPAFMYDYALRLKESALPNGKMIEEYFALIPKGERYSEKNIELLLDNAGALPLNGRAQDVIFTCRDTMIARYPKDPYAGEGADLLMAQFIKGLIESAAIDTNYQLVEEAIKLATSIKSENLNPPGTDLTIAMYYYDLTGNLKQYAETVCRYIPTYILPDSLTLKIDSMSTVFALNLYATNFFNVVTDKDKLAQAIYWTDRCLKILSANPALRENFQSAVIDTKANLLYKTGRIPEALKLKEEALAMIPVNEYTFNERKELQEEFDKMKKGEKTWY